MKRSRFRKAQIIGILKEHKAGMSAPDLCRKHGISDTTFYNWRWKSCSVFITVKRRRRFLPGMPIST